MKSLIPIQEKLKHQKLIEIYENETLNSCTIRRDVDSIFGYPYFYLKSFYEDRFGKVELSIYTEDKKESFQNACRHEDGEVRSVFLIPGDCQYSYTKYHENISSAKKAAEEFIDFYLKNELTDHKFKYDIKVINPSYPLCIPTSWREYNNYVYMSYLTIVSDTKAEMNEIRMVAPFYGLKLFPNLDFFSQEDIDKQIENLNR